MWLRSLVVRALDSRLDGRELDSRPPQLVLRWMTVFGRANHLEISPNHPCQLSLLTSVGRVMGNEYQPKCGDAVRMGSKDRYGSFYLWINVWVTGKAV